MAEDPHPPHSLYEAEHAERRTARVGMVLFLIYLLAYGLFVGLCAFRLDLMATRVGGVNLAIIYGFALIGFALILAAIYMFKVSSGNRQGRAK